MVKAQFLVNYGFIAPPWPSERAAPDYGERFRSSSFEPERRHWILFGLWARARGEVTGSNDKAANSIVTPASVTAIGRVDEEKERLSETRDQNKGQIPSQIIIQPSKLRTFEGKKLIETSRRCAPTAMRMAISRFWEPR